MPQMRKIPNLQRRGFYDHGMAMELNDLTRRFLSFAKEIWDAIEQTYSKGVLPKYKGKAKIVATNKIVTEYANQLKSLWMELDHYKVIKSKCSADSAMLKEYIDQDKVYDFFVEINSDFDQVKVQIFRKEKVPRINEMVAMAKSESRRTLMLESLFVKNLTMIANRASTKIVKPEKGGNDQHGEQW